MSGHSKWSTIKHKKALVDAKRGGVFTKLAGAIAVAVKRGGGIGDQSMNFALRLAIDKARAANMPKDKIDRAIARGVGKGDEKELEELVLEGYGPGGAAIIVEAVTDNRNRTVAEIKNLLEKQGGRLGEPGSVLYQFEKIAMVTGEGKLNENQELELIDLGMIELEEAEGVSRLTCRIDDMKKCVDYLQSTGMGDISGTVTYLPKNKLPISENTESIEKLLDTLQSHDDVQEVQTNADW